MDPESGEGSWWPSWPGSPQANRSCWWEGAEFIRTLFSSTGPQGGQLWAIWLGDNKAGLIFNMEETTEAQ